MSKKDEKSEDQETTKASEVKNEEKSETGNADDNVKEEASGTEDEKTPEEAGSESERSESAEESEVKKAQPVATESETDLELKVPEVTEKEPSFEWEKVKKRTTELASILADKATDFAGKATDFTKQSAVVIKQKAEEAADKVSDVTKIGKHKFDIATLKRRLEECFTNLGNMTYEMLKKDEAIEISSVESVSDLVIKIDKIYAEIALHEEEIKKLHEPDEKDEPAESEPEKKTEE